MIKFFLLILSIFLTTCQKPNSYQKIIHFEKGWQQDESIFFEFTPEQAGTYQIELLLRYQNNYPYYNFYLFKTFYSKDNIQTDTLQFYLQNPETGVYYGKGYNAIFSQNIPLETRELQTEKYKIELQHGMRDSILNGILDIGILLHQDVEDEK